MTLLTDTDVERAIAVRTKARRTGDQSLADNVKVTLRALGIELTDGPHGTTWRVSGDD